MWYPHHEFSWEWMIFMGLMMALFWAGIVLLVYWLVRSVSGAGARHQSVETHDAALPPKTALDILKERYARGEISKEEYQEMRDELKT